MRLSPVLLLLSYQFCFVSCFSTTTKILHQHHITPLWAKPRRNAKKKTNSGGGFGAPPPAAPEKKVRSVSGYTGSGTKPLRVAANTFDKLRKDFGAECTSDVYVRSPLNDNETFWFVGKIARCTNAEPVPTEEEAVLSQKRLILEYAKHQLRPQNFGGPYAKALELWLAPGDSEMDTVQNKVGRLFLVLYETSM